VLEVRGLSGGAIKNVDLDVRAGEIVGIGGLVGSGRSSLLSMIFGASPIVAGTITLDGVPIHLKSPRHAVHLGIGLIPENRREQGLLMSRSIRENTVLPHMRLTRWAPRLPLPSKQRETRIALRLSQDLGVVSRGPETLVSRLSGGNQQKVLLGRWLMAKNLRLLLLDEPTKGVDVGAKAEMFEIARQLARQGAAVVLVSSDLEEVAENCDRVVVLVEGRSVAELKGPCTEAEILEACYAAAE
jgi:ABC-type sugar transport system ATPase subunit